MNFETAHAFVARWEGGWVDDPHDPGGETKYGISKRAYPDVDIASLTRQQAEAIYERDYWQASRCPDLPGPLRLVHYDAAVNQGTSRAARFLQKAVGAAVDGIIGPKTLAAAQDRFGRDPHGVLCEYCARRAVHYGRLSTFGRFGLGWMRRLMDVHGAAGRAA